MVDGRERERERDKVTQTHRGNGNGRKEIMRIHRMISCFINLMDMFITKKMITL